MRASDYGCVFFGRTADHLHHCTGRDANGLYLDPKFVVPLVRRQHIVEHTAWNVVDVHEGAGLSPNVLRLTRSGLLLVRLADHHANGLVRLPAPFVGELGLMLQRIADELRAMP